MSANSNLHSDIVASADKPKNKSTGYLASIGFGTFGVSMPLDFAGTIKAAAKSRKLSVSKFLLICATEKLQREGEISSR